MYLKCKFKCVILKLSIKYNRYSKNNILLTKVNSVNQLGKKIILLIL